MKAEIRNLEKDTVWIIRRAGETLEQKDAKNLRETFQYGIETKVNPIIISGLMNNTKQVLQKMRIVVEELRQKK